MDRDQQPSRRSFLRTGIVGASAAVLAAEARSAEAESPKTKDEKVRYAELLPHEFRERIAKKPIAYLPLGTIEWHGEHQALGVDAIVSEGVQIECARRFGGIVMPPIHLGPDRVKLMDDGQTRIGADWGDWSQLEGSCYWVPQGLNMLIVDAILSQLKRAGFRAVFADGHGPSRWNWVENIPERETRFGMKLFGVTKEISEKWMSQVDHAARNETSMMMHFRPELVDLSQLPKARSPFPRGVGGEHPLDSTAAYGKECSDKSVELVGQLFTKAGLL